MNKLTKKEESKIQKFVKDGLKDADIAHGFDHIESVVNLAKRIGKDENANLRILMAAAYLHDIVHRGRVKILSDHTKHSGIKAGKFLKKIGFSKREIKHVKEVISQSAYESFEKGIKPTSKEAEVVRDADWLDAMGARGIGRAFACGACYGSKEMGKVKWNPDKPVKLKMNLRGHDASPIYHFFSKLLWLKDNMQTKLGRKIAKERHKFMVDFLKKYRDESQGLK